ncbi:tannase/feruloyl esterase family alpha/beta hydrolase [Streptomyces sp. VRA16 Mangrove soil]|uniref:tannase/feruloyl esterase family alpha/beta hydrolase n=1 Tax=Streptomyces sp. VRA16 Mangrove soil TaxID=2817434 RepID=UPI001A9EB119|nr:tannase/feruloyl esterase family alpha/beta hydrolase [Streptomyces sp. VRA16 Mangrove soil]MBO1332358.1 tannase/feruloyl esterase family alpha/beta hydrolase [Streptomyces sp. VRA16 Mangrove soil]
MRTPRTVTLLATAFVALTVSGPHLASAATEDVARCAGQVHARVPGAAFQQTACLDDLTTKGLAGTAYTDMTDQAGLTAKATQNPSGVPGIQIDGYFRDGSHTNTTHGWNHDSQFVIRMPEHWNGGLVVTASPGNRKQYSTDTAISDRALAQGYAYAATDKGNTGPDFYRDGKRAGDAVAEWNERTTQLTRAAKKAVALRYGHSPRRTYMTGISNAGYLTRWQLENHPELYDGGVDWEGVLWTTDGPNLFTTLPTAVAYGQGKADADDMYAAGFARGSEFLWPYHQKAYWGLTQKVYRAEFDPSYDPDCPGDSAGSTLDEMLAPCASDGSYRYADRPEPVRRAVSRVALTGRVGKPLLTLQGDLDTLLPIATDADVYARMADDQGRGRLHRTYRIQDGTHTDGLYDTYPDRLRPILPCYRDAFDTLTRWVEHGTKPPADHTVRRPASGDVVNSCSVSAP